MLIESHEATVNLLKLSGDVLDRPNNSGDQILRSIVIIVTLYAIYACGTYPIMLMESHDVTVVLLK